MSVDAAATLAQIIPILLLAWVLELAVHPALRGRQRLVPALVMTVLILWPVVVEYALVRSVIYQEPLGAGWAWAADTAVLFGLALVALPHILRAWNFGPRDPDARVAVPDAD